MKNSLIILSLFLSISVAGNESKPFHLLDQLAIVNKYWLSNADAVAVGTPSFELSDTELIQLHLQLVEKNLRARNTDHLTSKQQMNRAAALDILHNYWQQGIFPQNIYHTQRTPYFIDHLNTACAVGYLIIHTGHQLANQISTENNYAYIEDMNYPQMNKWADDFGFTLEELQWIQPSYSCSYCDPDTVLHVTYCGGSDGCIGLETVDFSSFDPGLQFTYEKVLQYHLGLDDWIDPHPSHNQPCHLPAGYFKLIFHDQFKANYEFFYTLLEPQPLVNEYEITHEEDDCSGTIRLTVTGGQQPYRYKWSTGDNSWFVTDLCAGEYYVTVEDDNGCVKVDTVSVSLQTNTENVILNDIHIFPNPVRDFLHMELLSQHTGPTSIRIVNAVGEKVYSEDITSNAYGIDISHLPDGVYFFLGSNDEKEVITRFIKVR